MISYKQANNIYGAKIKNRINGASSREPAHRKRRIAVQFKNVAAQMLENQKKTCKQTLTNQD